MRGRARGNRTDTNELELILRCAFCDKQLASVTRPPWNRDLTPDGLQVTARPNMQVERRAPLQGDDVGLIRYAITCTCRHPQTRARRTHTFRHERLSAAVTDPGRVARSVARYGNTVTARVGPGGDL
jgi:hypothetical protein